MSTLFKVIVHILFRNEDIYCIFHVDISYKTRQLPAPVDVVAQKCAWIDSAMHLVISKPDTDTIY